jgi:hypothetical protein
MTWPGKRVTQTALWRATEEDTDTGDPRARTVRRKDTRKMVRGVPARKAGKR